jgi:hypothetical protein
MLPYDSVIALQVLYLEHVVDIVYVTFDLCSRHITLDWKLYVYFVNICKLISSAVLL